MTDRADLYRRAAEIVAAGKNRRVYPDCKYDGSCDVLTHHEYGIGATFEERTKYHAMFVAGEYYMMQDVMPESMAQKVRVLALCFMAAMVEAGDA